MEVIDSPYHMRKQVIDLARRYFGPNIFEATELAQLRHCRLGFGEHIKGGFFEQAYDRKFLSLCPTQPNKTRSLFELGGVYSDMDIFVNFEEHFEKAIQFSQACERLTQKKVRLIKNWT